jgi:hypothetical protein
MRAVKSDGQVVDLAQRRLEPLRGQRIGRLAGWSAAEGALIDYPGNPHGPIAARALAPLDDHRLEQAAASHLEVLLSFDAERSDRPIIVGLIEPRAATVTPIAESREIPPHDDAHPLLREVTLDGQRVVVEAKDELVLKCGEASITLRRNGRVVIRGAYVETRSRGVNRIKGGSVQIN